MAIDDLLETININNINNYISILALAANIAFLMVHIFNFGKVIDLKRQYLKGFHFQKHSGRILNDYLYKYVATPILYNFSHSRYTYVNV